MGNDYKGDMQNRAQGDKEEIYYFTTNIKVLNLHQYRAHA
jgi:hypothetical protein